MFSEVAEKEEEYWSLTRLNSQMEIVIDGSPEVKQATHSYKFTATVLVVLRNL